MYWNVLAVISTIVGLFGFDRSKMEYYLSEIPIRRWRSTAGDGWRWARLFWYNRKSAALHTRRCWTICYWNEIAIRINCALLLSIMPETTNHDYEFTWLFHEITVIKRPSEFSRFFYYKILCNWITRSIFGLMNAMNHLCRNSHELYKLPWGIMRNRPCDSCSGGPGEFGGQILKRPIRVVDVSPSAIAFYLRTNDDKF